MSIWEMIINKILKNTAITYVGIGSAMPDYQEVTDKNNQQYPCFLDKFNGKKVIILIDPMLERPLKVESYFLKRGQALEMVELCDCRYLYNQNIDLFAINSNFYYMNPTGYNADHDISIIINLISACMNGAKLILQDYTGKNTVEFYTSLFNIFNRQDMINNILFDVTQKDGGCFIEFEPNMVKLDSLGNFIQDRYIWLQHIHDTKIYEQILKERIDWLCYYAITYYAHTPDSHEYNKIKYMADIYEIKWDGSNSLRQLIDTVIHDVVSSRQCGEDVEKFLSDNIQNRNIFINTISVLKSLAND